MMNLKGSLLAIVMLTGLAQISYAESHKIISSYPDLIRALKRGDLVRAIIDFKHCASTTLGAQFPTDAFGGINFNSFYEHPIVVNGQQKTVVATADNLLVHHDQYGTVYNRLQLRVVDDGSVEFTGEILDPKTYTQLHETTYTCWISNGRDQNGVMLYNLS